MPAEPILDFEAILRTPAEHGVEYIVAGGVRAALHGASVTTFDLDIVRSRSPENAGRLLAALEQLDSVYRAQPEKRIKPAERRPPGTGRQLLLTRFGPLDVLSLMGAGRQYSDLLPHTIELAIDERLRVRLLDLDTLIRTKEEAQGRRTGRCRQFPRRVLEEKSRG